MPSSSLRRTTDLLVVAVLAIAAVTFVILYFQLAKSARLTPDDLCQLAAVREHGALGTQRRLFLSWSGRWASNLIVTLVMAGRRSPSLLGHALALLVLASGTTWLVLRATAARRVGETLLPLLAVVTVALLFFATPHRGDSWFFAFSSVENLVPLCSGALALVCVAGAARRPLLVYPGALAAAFAGAGHECVALSWLAAGASLLAWSVLRGATAAAVAPWRAPHVRTALVVLGVGAASFAVCALSPGTASRAAYLRHAEVAVALGRTLVGGPVLLAEVAVAAAPALVAATLVWTWAAQRFAGGDAPLRAHDLGRIAVALGALAVMVSWATVLPGYYALGEAPPTRAQLALATYLVGAAAILGVALGGFLRGRRSATVALATALVVALVFQRERGALIPDIASARIYARAYDARMAILADAAARREKTLLVLAPLPPSGLLRSAEITPDGPFTFTNLCLARAAGLRAGVVRGPIPPT